MIPEIRPYRDDDRDTVVGLWTACHLIVPWNDPDADRPPRACPRSTC